LSVSTDKKEFLAKLASYDKNKKKLVGGNHEDPKSHDQPEAAETESEDGGVHTRGMDSEGAYIPPEPVCMDEEESE